eukprot:evm.model.scf_96.6 EVM.evm.TU.scf_96.6   scf_96:92076-93720(+)
MAMAPVDGATADHIAKFVADAGANQTVSMTSANGVRSPAQPSTFVFEPGEKIENMILWDNGMDGQAQALGRIQFTTDSGRSFDAGISNAACGSMTILKDLDIGSGLVVGVRGGGSEFVVSIGFQFLKRVRGVSVGVDGYPGIEGVLPTATMTHIVASALCGNPTGSTESVEFSGLARLELESNWTTVMRYFGTEIETISAQTPYIDGSASGKLRWSLGDWQTHPLSHQVTETPSYNLMVTVPGGSKALVRVLSIEYGLCIRYVGTAIVKTENGGLWMFATHGMYSGKAVVLGEASFTIV